MKKGREVSGKKRRKPAGVWTLKRKASALGHIQGCGNRGITREENRATLCVSRKVRRALVGRRVKKKVVQSLGGVWPPGLSFWRGVPRELPLKAVERLRIAEETLALRGRKFE